MRNQNKRWKGSTGNTIMNSEKRKRVLDKKSRNPSKVVLAQRLHRGGWEFESLTAQDFRDFENYRPHTVPTLSKNNGELF
jgi:hypothetical protein